MSVEGLMDELVEAAGRMGHCMGEFNEKRIATCAVCGLVVHLDEGDAGLRVGGSALREFCETEYTFLASTERG
jgi:hypothetical protein